jgi:hypothetical protein
MQVRAVLVVCTLAGLTGAMSRAEAATYRVGIGEQFRELTALPPLVPGDVVEVMGGFTFQPVKFEADGTAAQPITIRGIRSTQGRRPVISAGENGLELAGEHYVVEGLEITGAAQRCVFVHAHGLVLRDLLVRDCRGHGIAGGGSGGGDLTLEYSELHHNGSGAEQHQVYVATDEIMHPGARFRMRFNYLHDGNGGNNVKSRAERNEIYFNWIEGALYHELELVGPDPAEAGVPENQAIEHSDVVGNVLAKGGGHSTFWIARIGGDGTGQTFGRYRFAYNTILLASDSAGGFRIFDGIDTFEAHNNVIHRTSTAATTPVIVNEGTASWRPARALIGSHNWVVDAIVNGVPAAADWMGTLRGADPGWNGFGDYRPLEGSALVDAADPAPPSPAGRPFPMPLPEPSFEPPLGRAMQPGAERPRPRVNVLDIGAFELGMGPPVDPDAGVGPGDGDGGTDPTGDGGTDPTADSGGCCGAGAGANAWPAALVVVVGLGLGRRRRARVG